jgi:hypothetical protein
MSVTNTASNAASALMNLTVGGATKFFVKPDGSVGIVTATPAATLTSTVRSPPEAERSPWSMAATMASQSQPSRSVASLARLRPTRLAVSQTVSTAGASLSSTPWPKPDAEQRGYQLPGDQSHHDLTGANLALAATRISMADLIYDATALRWIVLSTN